MFDDTFIWTEVYNCGEIGAVAINSFIKHHPDTVVHVYGGDEDLAPIPDVSTVRKVKLPWMEARALHLSCGVIFGSARQRLPRITCKRDLPEDTWERLACGHT